MSVPRYYTPDDLNSFDKDKLEIIAEARNLEVTGTGADGNILKEDLAEAITADQDASGLNPALAPVEPTEANTEPKRYRVGPSRWEDNEPGSEIEAVIPEARERMLLEGGVLQILPPAKAAKAKTTPTTGSASADKTKE